MQSKPYIPPLPHVMVFSSLNVITKNIFVKKYILITALVLCKDGITTTTWQNETKDQSTNHNTSSQNFFIYLFIYLFIYFIFFLFFYFFLENSNNTQLFCHESTELNNELLPD